jgi:release factor glutamine methyltransferase
VKSLSELLLVGTDSLRGVADRARFEAEILLSSASGMSRTEIITKGEAEIDEKKFYEMIERRRKYEPIEYITGKVSFYSREFLCSKGVLIPRTETELLIDHVLRLIKSIKNPRIIEIGSGSGVIAVMLAILRPDARILSTDINEKAIVLARRNAERFCVSDQIEFVCTPFIDGVDTECDIIVSNPPYIADDYPLNRTLLFEPREALIGGEKGTEILREIITIAQDRKIPFLACECGYDQEESLTEELKGCRYAEFYRDYANLTRGFTAQTI